MKILFALPGLHRFERGAEIAFTSLASALVNLGNEVTLTGSGEPRAGTAYRFLHAGSIRRERFEGYPKLPMLRGETSYEEASFAPALLAAYRPADYDLTMTCSYPFTNWVLRRPRLGGARPPHVFVTQNGDWPAIAGKAEYRLFGCEGMVCTNPDFYDRNRERWRCALIPNGMAAERFTPGAGDRARFGAAADATIVLMVSALIDTKRVDQGVRTVARVPGAHLVVAGDGPERDLVDRLAAELLPGRFTRLTVAADEMPGLYRSADVFLHLSLNEAFGNVFIEAMACGLPVVTHDMARLRWIVGDDEWLIDTHDVAAIAAAIVAARDAPPGLRAARIRRAGTYDWPVVAAQYHAFFAEVVAAAKAPRSP